MPWFVQPPVRPGRGPHGNTLHCVPEKWEEERKNKEIEKGKAEEQDEHEGEDVQEELVEHVEQGQH